MPHLWPFWSWSPDDNTAMAQRGGEVTEKRKLALIIEYEGTNYNGFQFQPNVATVQGELEQALEQLLGKPTRIKGASRTDTGVHAQGQVITFESEASYPESVYVNALNSYLSEDIRVRSAYAVPQEFDARRHATSRVYEYRMLNTATSPALLRRFAHWVREPLNVDAMAEAARKLVGVHDFVAFTVPQATEKSTFRNVYKWDVERQGEMVMMRAEANAYLYQQIRRTAGALVKVGTGKSTIEEFEELLEGKRCGSAGPLLPAKGLFLVRVNYPDFPPTSGVNNG